MLNHQKVSKYYEHGCRRKISDKVLRDKAFKIAKKLKLDGSQRNLAEMVYILFDKKCSGTNASGGAIKIAIISNQLLREELHKPIMKSLNNEKYTHLLKLYIWVADLADTQLISKNNKL